MSAVSYVCGVNIKKLNKSPVYVFLWKIDVVKVLDLEFLVISTSRKGNFLSCSSSKLNLMFLCC